MPLVLRKMNRLTGAWGHFQRILIAAALLIQISSSLAQAEESRDNPALFGLEIAERTKQQESGFISSEARLIMTLMDASGNTSTRELRQKVLEMSEPDIGDKSLLVFDRPRDVSGTALLTHAKIIEPDDQWLYLPSLRRVKRIASANKSGPFVGSEFAFEDLSSQEVGKFEYLWLRDEACPAPVDDRTCFVIERKPLYPNSGYVRQVAWVDQQDFLIRQIDYYNRRNVHSKSLTLSDYRQYGDTFWRSHDLFMINLVSGKKTRLTWQSFEFDTGLTESDFDQASLRQVR